MQRGRTATGGKRVEVKHVEGIMIDLETLGVRDDCVVTQIAAVHFKIDPFEVVSIFDKYISVQSSLDNGQTIDAETLLWWVRTNPVKLGYFLNRQKEEYPASLALTKLMHWVPGDVPIWSRGTDFDIGILKNMCRRYDIHVPWRYNLVRDFRTVHDLFSESTPEGIVNPNPHDALSDAIYQVALLSAYLRGLK